MPEQVTVGIIAPVDMVTEEPVGGTLGYLANLIEKLHVRARVYGFNINRKTPLEPQRLGENADFLPLGNLSYPSRVPMRVTSLVRYFLGRRKIMRDRADILYIHNWEIALLFLFRTRHIPVVFHQHGSTNPALLSRFKWARNPLLQFLFDEILRVVHRRADWIIAIDGACLSQAYRHGGKGKTTLLLNGVDTGKFHPDMDRRTATRLHMGCEDGDRVLLFVGRLEQVKQVDRIIDALPLLDNSNGSVHLYIVGSGSERQFLTRRARERGVDGRCTFLDRITHGEMPDIYNAADLLILSSKREGTPMVVLEALACGTPVLASSVGGVPALIEEPTNGMLLSSATPQEIADKTEKLLTASLNREIVAATVRQHDMEVITEKLEQIFHSLAKETHSVATP
jgi:glycosyltransferase involved in cell wall biosynthesis